MKRRPKPLLVTLILLPVIAFAAFYFSHSQQVSSEATMLANFQQQKPILLQLIRMATGDNLRWTNGSASECLGAIDYDKKTGAAYYKKERKLSEKRQREYRALMQQAGVRNVVFNSRHGICRFGVYSGGAMDQTWGIGYAWAAKPSIPMTIVPSAYNQKRMMDGTIVYSKIEKDWFIYQRG